MSIIGPDLAKPGNWASLLFNGAIGGDCVRTYFGWLIPCLIVVTGAAAQNPQSPQQPDDLSIVRALPNGLVTVASLDLPEPFLNHVIAWELRGAWRDANHRVKVPPDAPHTNTATPPPVQDPFAAPPGGSFTIASPQSLKLDRITLDTWLTIPLDVPELRGFRAPFGTMADDPFPFALSQSGDRDEETAQRYRRAATFVAERLA
jgi:hypothetical protein